VSDTVDHLASAVASQLHPFEKNGMTKGIRKDQEKTDT
jgi:hypothetical protein